MTEERDERKNIQRTKEGVGRDEGCGYTTTTGLETEVGAGEKGVRGKRI